MRSLLFAAVAALAGWSLHAPHGRRLSNARLQQYLPRQQNRTQPKAASDDVADPFAGQPTPILGLSGEEVTVEAVLSQEPHVRMEITEDTDTMVACLSPQAAGRLIQELIAAQGKL